MNQTLKTTIEEIYRDFQPLQSVHNQLLSTHHGDPFHDLVASKLVCLPSEQQQRVWHELLAWGPLEPLREQEDVFDIIIQGPQHIFVHNSEGLKAWPDHFLSAKSFKNFTERLCREANILIDQKEPFANGRVGPFRVHMIIPPAAHEVTITLRRHQATHLPWDHLLSNGFVSSQQYEVIQELIGKRKNLLIVGPTGSGKTTFLNTLMEPVASRERIVVIEDTDELQWHHPLICKLLSREVCPKSLNPFDMGDLLKQALRMRPDRLVVGEVRGPEAKDLLMALATGHAGSMGTLHAESAAQALLRLEMLIQMGAPQWSLESIRRLILMSLDALIILKSDRHHKGVASIQGVRSLEKFGLLLEPLHSVAQVSQSVKDG